MELLGQPLTDEEIIFLKTEIYLKSIFLELKRQEINSSLLFSMRDDEKSSYSKMSNDIVQMKSFLETQVQLRSQLK